MYFIMWIIGIVGLLSGIIGDSILRERNIKGTKRILIIVSSTAIEVIILYFIISYFNL